MPGRTISNCHSHTGVLRTSAAWAEQSGARMSVPWHSLLPQKAQEKFPWVTAQMFSPLRDFSFNVYGQEHLPSALDQKWF